MVRYLPLAAVGVLAALAFASSMTAGDWRTASREPVGLAPPPALTPEAVIQVYAARAVRWRGYFGVHTWIAAKAPAAPAYTVYEVNGWRLRRSGNAVVASARPPDGRWFGNVPELLTELRGPVAEGLLPRLEAAVEGYAYAGEYRVWPGPNSNTFTAHVLREIPELGIDLPPTAIGKDFIGGVAAAAPSGTGYQLNILGAFGVLVALEEGLEINVLGLTFGVDPLGPALKLPIVGRLEGLALVLTVLAGVAVLGARRLWRRAAERTRPDGVEPSIET